MRTNAEVPVLTTATDLLRTANALYGRRFVAITDLRAIAATAAQLAGAATSISEW